MNPSTRLDFDKQNRARNSNKRKRGKALQGSILWQHLKVAPGYLTPVRHGLSRPSARSERQRSGLSAVTLTPRGRRLRRRHRGQVGSAELNCTSGKVGRRISCLHRGSDGKAASEVFSILPGVQPCSPDYHTKSGISLSRSSWLVKGVSASLNGSKFPVHVP